MENKISDFGEVLNDAIKKKQDSIDNLVWKNANGSTVKLMDMEPSALKKAYEHSNSMLNSTNRYSPGKYQVRKNIWNMYANCNAELLLRYILNVCEISELKTNKNIVDLVNLYRAEKHIKDSDPVTVIFEHLPTMFENVTIEKLVRACLDSLEPFNKGLVSNNFIISEGIWFTDAERKDLTEYDEDGNLRNRLDVMKERLFLKDVRLRVDPKGLSYNEFRALINLEPYQKFSTIPSSTLELLRDKVLLALDNNLEWHIQKWTKLIKDIEKVAECREIKLK